MKFYLITTSVLFLSFLTQKCNKENAVIYKGRLEIKGICMNYTIKLLEGNMDTSLYVKSWKDDVTGITHQQVFALGSVCSFPASLNEGDEFSFTIDPSPPRNCSVCLAYYPKPPKSIAIKVLNR